MYIFESHDFFENPTSKLMPPMGYPPLKNEACPLKNKAPFQKIIPRKKTPQKSETVINNCVSLIKQQWKKMAEDFLTCSIRNFVRKVKQFVRKYYMT